MSHVVLFACPIKLNILKRNRVTKTSPKKLYCDFKYWPKFRVRHFKVISNIFLQACIIGDVDAVRRYITTGHKDFFNKPDQNGCNALFYAIQKNHVVIVKDLIKAGAGMLPTNRTERNQ